MTTLKRQFHTYNRRLGLDLDPDTIVIWSRRLPRGVAGDYSPGTIRINAALKPFASVWKLSLVHEMAHAATESELTEHGPRWLALMRRLARTGALDKLW